MKILPLLVVLLTAAPVVGQSRLYTNEDLGRPLSPGRGTVSPEQLAALAQHQYQAPPTPARELGPWVYVMRSSPTAGPFGEFAPFPTPVRLDGTSYRDPPWFMSAYVGRSYGRSGSSPARPDAPRTSARVGLHLRHP